MRGKKENVREVFPATIDRLKERAEEKGTILTDEAIATELGISVQTFELHYKKDNAPAEMFDAMRKIYKQFIGTLYIERLIIVDDFDDAEEDEEE
jgi:hypothetical protein